MVNNCATCECAKFCTKQCIAGILSVAAVEKASHYPWNRLSLSAFSYQIIIICIFLLKYHHLHFPIKLSLSAFFYQIILSSSVHKRSVWPWDLRMNFDDFVLTLKNLYLSSFENIYFLLFEYIFLSYLLEYILPNSTNVYFSSFENVYFLLFENIYVSSLWEYIFVVSLRIYITQLWQRNIC